MTEGPAASLGMPGRPSSLVYPDPEGAVVLALDIEVDSLAAAVVGLGGQVLDHVRVDRPRGDSSVEQVADDLAELVDVVRARRTGRSEIAIGVAVVGVVRRADGLVSMAPNLGWTDVPLGERLTWMLGGEVPIHVANEADLGALAEVRRGAALGADHVLFMSGEVGVGGGLIVEGQPFTGVAGYGGEIGHMPVNRTELACHCGSVGCWETEVGAVSLLRRAGRLAGRADGPRSTSARAVRSAGSPIDLRGARGDRPVAGVRSGRAGQHPEPATRGHGRAVRPDPPFVAEAVDAGLDRTRLSAPRRLVRVVPATLGAEAPLLGRRRARLRTTARGPGRWVRPAPG